MKHRRYRRRRELARAIDLRAQRAREAKAAAHPPGGSQGGLFSFATSQQTLPPSTWENIRRHGYEGNEIAYMGIAEIATTFASIPIVVRDKVTKEVVTDHPLTQLFARGAPSLANASGGDIRELWASWLYVSGNGLLEKIRDDAGRVVELWPVRMDRISGKPGKQRLFEHYVYTLNGRKFRIPVEDMLHARMPSLSDDYWGMSPLKAAFARIVGDNSAAKLIHSWLENRAVPGIAIMSKGVVDGDKADRAREAYYEQVEGKEGGVIVLGESTAVKLLAFDFQQLAMPDLMAQAESRILGCIGVPPILVGAKVGLDKASYANYANARKSFYHETVKGLVSRYVALFFGDPDFDPGEGLELAGDVSELDALAEERNAQHEQVREDHVASILTKREARVRMGYPAEVPPELEDDEEQGPVPDPAEAIAGAIRALSRRIKPASGKFKSLDRTEQVSVLEASIQGIARTGMGKIKTAFLEHYALVQDDVVALIDRDGQSLIQAQLVADAEELEKSLAPDAQLSHPEEAKRAPEIPDDFEEQLGELQAKWGQDAAERLGPLINDVVTKSGSAIGANIGVAFDLDNARVLDFVERYTVKFAQRTSQSTLDGVRAELLKAMDGEVTVDGLRQNFEKRFPEWSSSKAEMVARSETNRAANIGAKGAYVEGGATKLKWLTSSDPCEFCAQLSGQIVGVDQVFVKVGSNVTGVNGGTLKNRYLDVEAPPLHPHCVCTIVAED